MSAAYEPAPTGDAWGEAFAAWLEAGERFAGEVGPAAVDSALGDTLVSSFGYWGPVLAPFGPEPAVTQ